MNCQRLVQFPLLVADVKCALGGTRDRAVDGGKRGGCATDKAAFAVADLDESFSPESRDGVAYGRPRDLVPRDELSLRGEKAAGLVLATGDGAADGGGDLAVKRSGALDLWPSPARPWPRTGLRDAAAVTPAVGRNVMAACGASLAGGPPATCKAGGTTS